MTSPIEKTLALLDLEKIDKNVFSWQGENFGWHRIYGGQVMAQSLIAAYQTIEKKLCIGSYDAPCLRDPPTSHDKSSDQVGGSPTSPPYRLHPVLTFRASPHATAGGRHAL